MSSTPIVNAPSAIAVASRLLQLAQPSQGGCGCGCGDQQEVNAGLCPIPTLQFPRFFAGELVQPADLTAIEQRTFSHEQLRARHTIGWGISCGFRVAIDGEAAQQTPTNPTTGATETSGLIALSGATLRVEAGYGIDRYGRDVYMASNYSKSLADLFTERQARITKAMGDPWCAVPGCQPTPPTHFCVAVRYKECLADPVPSYAQQCGTPKTLCDYSRVNETVEIRIFGDNEFPTLPVTRPTQTWCGLPRQDLQLADLWNLFMTIPAGVTDVAAAAQSASAPSQMYTMLASQVAGLDDTAVTDAEAEPSCLDLLHMARACDPCVAWPWIPLACFTVDGQNVTAPDCRVRRTIYSLQEIEAAVVRLFCLVIELSRGREVAQQPAPAPAQPPSTPK
ncbi:MAG TPA: hypothetical protein VME66_15460 [Candidatus Acidoferrales bacterium]|nr:hypothetical protein [Candidatus Acidoferrales bacterium]